jgi:membrane-bound lytic murein transglycosylase D
MDAARHVGMTEDELRDVNRIPARMLVKAGSTLLVPRSAQHMHDVTEHVADNAHHGAGPRGAARRAACRSRSASQGGPWPTWPSAMA